MTVTSKVANIKSHSVLITVFIPDTPLRAIVQINHGLAEHSIRYHEFAQYLCDKGFGVYVHDHPGHGQTALDSNSIGHLNWKKGWDNMLDVIHSINKTIRKAHPNVPVFLMGHSMGSLLARHYNAAYPMYFKGMIISGTTNPDLVKIKSSLALVKILHYFKKDTHKNKWINNYFYRDFNTAIKNPITRFDWLSSQKEEVEKYISDPLCGFDLSLGFLKNLLQGSLQLIKVEKHLKFRKNFATLIISGSYDPVGNQGKDPKALRKKYINQGFFNTHIKLLDGRHELLNEQKDIKLQTYAAILNWMEEKLKGSF